MIIDKQLYVGGLPDRGVIRLIKKIKKFKPCASTYIITLPLSLEGMLEIYNANELRQRRYMQMEDRIHIVGIAPSKRIAVYLVRDIIDDIYRKTGGFDVNSYFSTDS